MKKPLQAVAALLAALLGGLAASPALASGEASVVRGGRLYDHWAHELNDRAPSGMHPVLFARRNDIPAADTWRCAECHGWDYRGRHGIAGIEKRRGSDPAAIVAILKDATHRYGGLINDDDLADIAQFVSQGQTDMKQAMAAAQESKPDPAGHAKHYGTICAACHGVDGASLREIPPLGESARQRPQEVLHVVINGHPGRSMPALRSLGTDFAVRMLSFLKTLPSQNLAVSIARGGRLYDNWQSETGAQGAGLSHPAYPPKAFYAGDAPTTWRCKSCHGWDYLGNQGAYATGRHLTGIKGIHGMAGAPPDKIAAILRDATHRFDAVLKERDIRDLANFVSLGQVDMATAIGHGTGVARGTGTRATAAYQTICAACHGIDGTRIITAIPLGRVARTNPWESLHKIMNGHPGEKMPALRELDRQLLIDILAHLQGLPDNRRMEGR